MQEKIITIAHYDGWKFNQTPFTEKWYMEGYTADNLYEIPYHTDWNWLIKVVKKLRIDLCSGPCGYLNIIPSKQVDRTKYHKVVAALHIMNKWVGELDIDELFESVVHAIQLLNEYSVELGKPIH